MASLPLCHPPLHSGRDKRGEIPVTTITDEYMQQMLAKTRNYTIAILTAGPQKNQEGAEKIIWQHGRRNFELRADGVLAIVCPIRDDSEVCGLDIYHASVEEVQKIMD